MCREFDYFAQDGRGVGFTRQPGELCSSWLRHCCVLLCTSAECGAGGWQGGPKALADPQCLLPAVPLPSAVPRVCRGWRFRALPRGLQPAGVPLHGRRGLHRGGWDAVGAAAAREQNQKRAPARVKHPGLAKGIPKKNPSFS